MRTKGHELQLEKDLLLKSASNSFANALCGINSPEKKKYNKRHTQQEGGQVALDSEVGNLMSQNPQRSVFRLSVYIAAPKIGIFITVKICTNLCRSLKSSY